VSAVAVYIAFIVFIFYFNELGFSWFGGYWNVLGVTLVNALFVGGVYWNLYGRKLDPYQSIEDRYRNIKVIVIALVLMSIATTLSIVIHIILKVWDYSSLKLTFTSLYSQLIDWASIIGLLHVLRIEDNNYNVYKANETSASV